MNANLKRTAASVVSVHVQVPYFLRTTGPNGHMLCCNIVFTGTRKVKRVDHHSIPMLYPYVLVV